MFGLVSKKKYDEQVSRNADVELRYLEELNKQKEINRQLMSFSESFRQFYKDIKDLPMLVKTKDNVVTMTQSKILNAYDVENSGQVEIIKRNMAHYIADNLLDNGLLQLDVITGTDGRATLKMSLNVVSGDDYRTNNV